MTVHQQWCSFNKTYELSENNYTLNTPTEPLIFFSNNIYVFICLAICLLVRSGHPRPTDRHRNRVKLMGWGVGLLCFAFLTMQWIFNITVFGASDLIGVLRYFYGFFSNTGLSQTCHVHIRGENSAWPLKFIMFITPQVGRHKVQCRRGKFLTPGSEITIQCRCHYRGCTFSSLLFKTNGLVLAGDFNIPRFVH